MVADRLYELANTFAALRLPLITRHIFWAVTARYLLSPPVCHALLPFFVLAFHLACGVVFSYALSAGLAMNSG
jgi:TRAP-type C4-dicarboxylate transport system permease small subunit